MESEKSAIISLMVSTAGITGVSVPIDSVR